jgi:hypothetical protein
VIDLQTVPLLTLSVLHIESCFKTLALVIWIYLVFDMIIGLHSSHIQTVKICGISIKNLCCMKT